MFIRFAATSISSIALLRSLRNMNDIKRSFSRGRERHCEALRSNPDLRIMANPSNFIRFAAISISSIALLRSLRNMNDIKRSFSRGLHNSPSAEGVSGKA
ncbi:MAG: hypothetical protein LBV04_03420 [Deferribacteraceae bacterium]|nr:hypothetical protein [Deferribacteraceae bacterium]